MRWGLVLLLSSALLFGGWLWLRGSSLVGVSQVRILGVHGPQAAQIEAALRTSAEGMTTLRFDDAALHAAVSAFPVVEGLRVSTSFPHGVRIAVVERPAVAMLAANGERTAVAADGTVLGPALLSSALPLVNGPFVPSTGTRVADESVLSAVTVLGAAPARLARFVVRVYMGPEGLTVAMRNGLLAYFGDATRPHAKWLSLASVLADPGSAGAAYIDVRVPSRPAAGHGSGAIAGQPAATASAGGTEGASGATNAAAAALAERLANTVGGGAISKEAASAVTESEHSASSEEGSSGGAGGERASPEATPPTAAGRAPTTEVPAPTTEAPVTPAAPGSEGGSPPAPAPAGGTAAH